MRVFTRVYRSHLYCRNGAVKIQVEARNYQRSRLLFQLTSLSRASTHYLCTALICVYWYAYPPGSLRVHYSPCTMSSIAEGREGTFALPSIVTNTLLGTPSLPPPLPAGPRSDRSNLKSAHSFHQRFPYRNNEAWGSVQGSYSWMKHGILKLN